MRVLFVTPSVIGGFIQAPRELLSPFIVEFVFV